MRHGLFGFTVLLFSFLTAAQSAAPPPQTARQALIEMFFGTSPNHLERHLADETRKSFGHVNSGEGRNLLYQLSSFSSEARSGGAKIETFDTGPTILTVVDPREDPGDKLEVSVERDDLIGDENEIELALHLPQKVREEALPITPHLTFAMKQDANIWRLTDITVSVTVPLTDREFLKTIEDSQRRKSEQATLWSVHQINAAEQAYSAAQGKFACNLKMLWGPTNQPNRPVYLWDPQLAEGKKSGYIFVVSECDAVHYKVVAEPETSDSGQRAFCSDQGGAIRASEDGKAATCLRSGEPVADPFQATPSIAVQPAE